MRCAPACGSTSPGRPTATSGPTQASAFASCSSSVRAPCRRAARSSSVKERRSGTGAAGVRSASGLQRLRDGSRDRAPRRRRARACEPTLTTMTNSAIEATRKTANVTPGSTSLAKRIMASTQTPRTGRPTRENLPWCFWRRFVSGEGGAGVGYRMGAVAVRTASDDRRCAARSRRNCRSRSRRPRRAASMAATSRGLVTMNGTAA